MQKPVKLFAQLAIASARAIDPLFKDSLMTLARDLAPNERDDLVKARDAALDAIHGFADRLEKRLPSMVDFTPMGEANYNYYLKHVLLLPLDAQQVEMLGGRSWRVTARWNRSCPIRRWPIPNPARSKNIPPDQASFLESVRKPPAGDDRLPEATSVSSRSPIIWAVSRSGSCPKRSSRPAPAAS